jgi:hypothetical protein
MSITNVDFGRLDAETETSLSEYFVDTGVLQRIVNGDRQYVIGRKGSGKTALFRKLDKDVVGHPVVQLDFDDYSWESHKILRDQGASDESAYVSSWRFTLLMSVVDQWSRNGNSSVKSKSRAIMSKIYGNEDPKWYNLLFDKFRKLRRLDLPTIDSVGSLGGIEFDAQEDEKVIASTIGVWSKRLFDFIRTHFEANRVTLLLDRLDEGWDGNDRSKQLLSSVIKASREINLELRNSGKCAPVVIFLRSDIFYYLQFNDKNKIGADIEFLDWTEERLIEVASTRIARSLGVEVEDAWDTVFSQKVMRQRVAIRNYILKRTMLRPRDIIAFCINCKEAVNKSGHPIVETDDVYFAEDAYSRHIYSELDDEMHKQLPRASDSLQVLRDMRQQKFRLSDWNKSLTSRLPDATPAESIDRLKELFEYSVVGVPRKGGRSGGTTFQFIYQDRLLQPQFNDEMIVHFSLKKVLSLRDRGA